MNNIVIFGASGAIGDALIRHYRKTYPSATIHTVARLTSQQPSDTASHWHAIELSNESALSELMTTITEHNPIDLAIVAIGTLHNDSLQPEKSIAQISMDNFNSVFHVNTFLPSLIAKHVIPHLNKKCPATFAVLSARVGSISDNRMGGWHAYRASKAALNMLIKNMAIETKRRNKQAILLALHPGTVDSNLSAPFQGNVPEGKLFTPEYCAQCLATVIAQRSAKDSGKIFAWDGQEITP